MKKEELVELGLTEELATKVVEKYGEMIPKARFDEVNERMKTAEATVKDRDKQIETLKKSAADNDDLQKQISDLQMQNKAAADKYAADIKERSRNNSVALALTGKKARDIGAAKALVKFEDSDFDENNELSKSGLAKIDKAVTDNGWAFEVESKTENNPPDFRGVTPQSQSNNPGGDNPGSTGASAALRFLNTNGFTTNNKQ